MNNMAKKRLGDLLVEARKIDPEQLREVLIKQQGSNRKLGEILINDGILSEEEIL